jgi:signal transduction histidine kinase
MTYHWIVPLVAAILNAVVGLVVIKNNSKSGLNRCFTFLSIAIVSWNLNIFALYFLQDEQQALYWSGVFRVGTLMAASLASHLMVLLSGTRSRIVWSLLGLSYALTIVLVAANASGYLVSNLQTYPWGFYPVGTSLYELFPVLVGFNFVLSQGLLIQILRTSDSPRQRQQARLWIVGSLIAMPFAMTNLFATFGIYFYPLGNLASVVYAGFIAYSIVRYRLMDTNIVLTKGGAYTVVILLVIAPAFAALLWLQARSFGRVDTDFSVALLVLLVLVALLFPVLRLRAESSLERSFFRKKYEYRNTLNNFTRSMVRIIDRGELIRQLGETLSSSLVVDRTAIVLFEEARRSLRVQRTDGARPATEEFPVDHPLLRVLVQRRDAVLLDELEGGDGDVERSAAMAFRSNGWEVCLPMIAGRKLIGFIALGRKANVDPYFAEDLELLETLASQAAIALENTQLYDELKRSQEIIRRADRLSALGTLAAGIAHEINNPLVSIQTFFQLAPERLNDQEFLTEFLALTSSEVKRITDLISDLLSFARSPSASTVEVELNEILEEVIRLLDPQLRKACIRVQRSVAPDLPFTHGDPDQLKQVFLNVILNAVQAMENGGELKIASRQVVHNGERYCQISVADTGVGIPEELLDDIFNPFLTTKEKGTGLGLSITNQVISEHQGFITVESELGKGSTFRIHLRPWRTGDQSEQDEPMRMVEARARAR